jgi:hypothetical protein
LASFRTGMSGSAMGEFNPPVVEYFLEFGGGFAAA